MRRTGRFSVVLACAAAAWMGVADYPGKALGAGAKIPAGAEALWAGGKLFFEV